MDDKEDNFLYSYGFRLGKAQGQAGLPNKARQAAESCLVNYGVPSEPLKEGYEDGYSCGIHTLKVECNRYHTFYGSLGSL